MSIRYKYVTKGHLQLKDLEGFNKLCREEEDIKWGLLNSEIEHSKYYQRLMTYAKKNRFNLVDLADACIDRYNEYKNKYHFILAKDKKDNLLGYICFEHIKLDTEEEIKDIIIVKHMYISNAANHTHIDNEMFYVLENIVEKCVIYSDNLYNACNSFKGYCLLTEPFRIRPSRAVKFKKANRFPGDVDTGLRCVLHTMGDYSKYANISRIN